MVNAYNLIDFKLNTDKSCEVRYKIAFGDSPSEASYIVRTLNKTETADLVTRLSKFVDNYNKG
jgi:hypothetical protein|tara:strand:+ start:1170 stop:1358 length:189 start_codon:yes stop_codon:yes gene_type:complete